MIPGDVVRVYIAQTRAHPRGAPLRGSFSTHGCILPPKFSFLH